MTAFMTMKVVFIVIALVQMQQLALLSLQRVVIV